jgi:hypothetical protein
VVAALDSEPLVGVRIDALAVGPGGRVTNQAPAHGKATTRAANDEPLGLVRFLLKPEGPSDQRQRPEWSPAAAGVLAAPVRPLSVDVDLPLPGVEQIEPPPVA